jgi:hypothetical protein
MWECAEIGPNLAAKGRLSFHPKARRSAFLKSALRISCLASLSDNKSRSSLATCRLSASSIRRSPELSQSKLGA